MVKNRLINPAFRTLSENMPIAALVDNTPTETAQKWFVESFAGGGTALGVALTQQPFSAAQITMPGVEADFNLQIAFDGTGAPAAGSFFRLYQRVPLETLSGYGTQLSLWIKSSVADIPIAVQVRRYYGTGGSPSPDEILADELVVLSAGYLRYSVPVTVSAIADPARPYAARIPGTNNDGYIEISIYFQCQSGAVPPIGIVSPLTFNLALAQWEQGTFTTSWEEPPIIIKGELQTDIQANGLKFIGIDFGATTIGSNLMLLPNPSAVVWLRVNADNTVTVRTAAQTLSDLAGGNAPNTANGLVELDGSGNLVNSSAAVWANPNTRIIYDQFNEQAISTVSDTWNTDSLTTIIADPDFGYAAINGSLFVRQNIQVQSFGGSTAIQLNNDGSIELNGNGLNMAGGLARLTASDGTADGSIAFLGSTDDGASSVAIGNGANSYNGGVAVGYGAYSDNGGAVGYGAYSDNGGAVGYGAYSSNSGGAIGYNATSANGGGAVGYGANATTGFAGGASTAETGGGANFCGGTYAGTGIAINGNEIANVNGQITSFYAIQRITYTGGATAAFSITADSTHNILAFANGSTSSTTTAVTLPTGGFDGQTLDISYKTASTTITYAGASQIGGITAAVLGAKQRFIWDATLSEWR